MIKIRQIVPIAIAGFLLIAGCKRREAKWDVGVAVPLFNTNLSLDNIDNSFLSNSVSDSSYNLVYDNLIYSATLTNVKTPDTTINTSFSLRRLKLSDRSIVQNITLGQINPLFKLLDGSTQVIPVQDQANLNPIDIDASAFFETATLDSGFLDISLKNELPVKVKLILFEITNASDGSVVALDSFTDIPINGISNKSIDLRNKTVNKALKGTIKRLITEASSGAVLIEANKGVTLTLSVRKLRPRSAIAAFPNQTVIDQDQGLVLDMGGPELKYFKVKKGKLHIVLESTIQENMTMDFQIPSATLNGVPVTRVVKMPGATVGKTEKREEIIDMAGHIIDFRGKDPNVKDTVNTFHQILKVTLDSSGRKVQVTLRDSIRIFYSLDELVPEYAIGYLGNSVNATGPSSVGFGLFKGLDGDLKLKSFTASVLMKNYVGAQGKITVKKLEGENVFSGNKVLLNATPLNSPVLIAPPAFLRDAYTETKVILDQNNSNIKSFVELLPQKINYDLDVETNPLGNVSLWKDFIFDNSRVDIFLRLETPATFTVGGLTLRDTQPINLGGIKNIKKVKSAKLMVDVDNGYPFEAGMQLQFLDVNGRLLGNADFEGSNTIEACKTDASGKATGVTRSKLIIKLSRDKIWMLQQATQVIIKTTLKGAGASQKIYNTYKIKISTNGQFEYEADI